MNILLSLAVAAVIALQSPATPSPNFRPSKPTTEEPVGEVVFSYRLENELLRFTTDDLRVLTTDADYGCLPEKEVRSILSLLLRKFDNTYIPEARDCDDLALEFIVKYRRLAREVMDDVPLAVPAGLIDVKLCTDNPEMGYKLNGRVSYHAIVIIRCMGGKWLLVDPDTKKVSEFTQHLYEGTMELRRAIF